MTKKPFFLVFFLTIILLGLIINHYSIIQISDDKMEPGLIEGDKKWIVKHNSIVRQSQNYFSQQSFYGLTRNTIIILRAPSQNDVPIKKKNILVRRLIGLPQDEIIIQPEKVIVNGLELNHPDQVFYNYRMVCQNKNLPPNFDMDNNILKRTFIAEPGFFNVKLAANSVEKLIDHPFVDQIRILLEPDLQNARRNFPKSPYYEWNQSYFGPIKIPEKNQTININYKNVKLYERIITTYEGNQLEVNQNREILINGKIARHYTFAMNYYFVLNDDRSEFGDSRTWGFVPENHLIGFLP